MTNYFKKFAKLRTDSSPARWSDATRHKAPHKPFMLLTIMDLVAQGLIQSNLIEFKADLLDIFDLYWVKVMGIEKNSNPVLPFYHLKSDKFWHLVPVPGMEQTLASIRQIRSVGQLHQLVIGARLDNELFDLLLMDNERDELRRILIETYFSPNVRPKVVEVGQITSESFQYSLELLDRLRGRFVLREKSEIGEKYHTESRSVAFRRVVVSAYQHTCAICKIRLVTPEGRTAVAASHIIPWRYTHNDDPRNGMALCGLHHWCLDEGIISVTSDYQILVSPIIRQEQESTKPILLLSGQDLYLPKDKLLKPAKQALNWHRNNIFRAELPLRLI
ncbi:MAG: HNH endonuclease [Deltaproteobacteria bacterium]|nr:HNH endonuclease [Deltaproteobacteria bacterium]